MEPLELRLDSGSDTWVRSLDGRVLGRQNDGHSGERTAQVPPWQPTGPKWRAQWAFVRFIKTRVLRLVKRSESRMIGVRAPGTGALILAEPGPGTPQTLGRGCLRGRFTGDLHPVESPEAFPAETVTGAFSVLLSTCFWVCQPLLGLSDGDLISIPLNPSRKPNGQLQAPYHSGQHLWAPSQVALTRSREQTHAT